MLRRRALLATGAAFGVRPCVAAEQPIDWPALAADVKAQMAWAWANYRERAWGCDLIRPVSGTGRDYFVKGGPGVGLSLIEALDTLWVMGLDAQFEDGLRWVRANTRFDLDGEIQGFETSIRLVGGLLSAHHASGERFLLDLAHDLSMRMAPMFTRSPTGMPYRFVNLKTGAAREPKSNPAEVGGYLPEWGTLSKLTGETRWFDMAKRAMGEMVKRRSRLDLIADSIDVETGAWLSRRAAIAPPCDSFYEYLWDGWQLFGDAEVKGWYDTLTAAILKQQPDVIDGRLWFADVDSDTGARLNHRQDELSAFYGGLLAQGGAVREGARNTRAWAAAQDRFEILPEGFDPSNWSVQYKTNALRPELADAAFNLWLLDPKAPDAEGWRRLVRTHYLNMTRWNRATYGYSGIGDVIARPMTLDDECPGYWWSEQMKYYWLAFSDTTRFDYRDNYLSTEGNVFRGLRRG